VFGPPREDPPKTEGEEQNDEILSRGPWRKGPNKDGRKSEPMGGFGFVVVWVGVWTWCSTTRPFRGGGTHAKAEPKNPIHQKHKRGGGPEKAPPTTRREPPHEDANKSLGLAACKAQLADEGGGGEKQGGADTEVEEKSAVGS